MGLVGFGKLELDALFGVGRVGLTDPDAIPDLPTEPVTRAGDVWKLGPHRLACGDSTDVGVVDRCLAGAKPHLMVTDPPTALAMIRLAGLDRNQTQQEEDGLVQLQLTGSPHCSPTLPASARASMPVSKPKA